ncbi:MAG: helix-turn-helix domain-containing protein [Bacteroidetes bacterium]|nr:helix-turn-helix domain-containing protein [Bacteroidota bacterium]
MTSYQVSVYEELVRSHKTGQQTSTRAQILLLAHQGQSNSHIQRSLGISRNTVKVWRRRWEEVYPDLTEAEDLIKSNRLSQSDYRKQLVALLQDLPRPGSPKTFTLAQEQQIVALACDSPHHHGWEMTDWTHQMLAHVAMAKGIVASISSSQIGRILKKYPPPTA